MTVDPFERPQSDQDRQTWTDYWADRAPGPVERLPAPLRVLLAALVALCGGLALVYFVFAAIGEVDLEESFGWTIVAVILGAIWLVAFVARQRTDALRVQRPDRERRGY